jgi:hypothetical protein
MFALSPHRAPALAPDGFVTRTAMQDDFIEVYENALSPAECQTLIQRFESSRLAKPGATGNGVDLKKKDSLDIVISREQSFRDVSDAITANMFEHLVSYVHKYRFLCMGALALTLAHPETKAPTELNESTFDLLCNRATLRGILRTLYRSGHINMQKYLAGKGGYHHFHSEIFPKDRECEQLHRVLLWMYYLNDVEEGGETEFFYQGKKLAPRAGSLVIAPAGFTHTHKGHVPRSGDKYILTSWLLYQRAEKLFR